MKQYLFLYPIEEYVDSCIVHRTAGFEKGAYGFRYINQLIKARYRDKKYDINWLLFSLDTDNQKPDFGLISPYFEIKKQDRILNAGISFERHCKEKIYFDPSFVLDQLPPHERLVLGGFHQNDCVDRIAKTSYERGVSTFIDEDTTNHFFIATSLGTKIPLAREKWSLKDLDIPDSLIEAAKEIRKDKPWLTQT
jgi:hypothetical protein